MAAVVIPARNEAARIGAVLSACLAAPGVAEVIVVDDGSTDDTAAVSMAGGARVLRIAHAGKGGAMAAGAIAATDPVIAFLDADLTGLRPEHVEALAAPVEDGAADMAVGWIEGQSASQVRIISGQRALRRSAVLAVSDLQGSGYGAELVLARTAAEAGWRTVFVRLPGVSHVTKLQKRGVQQGLVEMRETQIDQARIEGLGPAAAAGLVVGGSAAVLAATVAIAESWRPSRRRR